MRAVQLGGVLGGASALVSYGIWVDTEPHGVVVSCVPTASRLPSLGPGERRVWLPLVAAPTYPWRVSVVDALLQYALDAPRDALVASVDSAINMRLLTSASYRLLIGALPERLRSIVRDVDGSAASGTETHMRLALLRNGYSVRTQVAIPRVGTVDLLVDGWLVVELDSKKFHDGTENQLVDRSRDGNTVLGGYGHERFMWAQVFHSMDWCLEVIAQRLSERAAFNRMGSAG